MQLLRYLLAVALCLAATNAQVTFTGNPKLDFIDNNPNSANTWAYTDNNLDVGLPDQFPPGSSAGWDFTDVFAYYDPGLDRLYFGIQTKDNAVIVGDVDGDGDPSFPGPDLTILDGQDLPDLGGEESVVVIIRPPGDASIRLGMGVSNVGDLSTIGAYTTFAPIIAETAPTSSFQTLIGPAVVFASPSPSAPGFEFYYEGVSQLPGFGFVPGQEFQFEFFVAAGAGFQDVGIGEERVPDSAGSYLTFEWPRQRIGSIGDFCFHDLDADGVFEPAQGEQGIAGCGITVYNRGDFSQSLTSTVTSADGSYLIINVPEGLYTLEFSVPPGFKSISPSGVDSYPNPVTRRLDIEVVSLSTYDTADVGVYAGADIGDFVFDDSESVDGRYNTTAGDRPLAGVLVNLLSGGSTVASTTTNEDGNYLFADLDPGSYQVQFAPPLNTPFVFSPSGPNNVATASGFAPPLTLRSAQDNLQQDAGLYDPTPPTCEGNCRFGFRAGCRRENGDCVCYCDDLCMVNGDCCADFCQFCSRVDREGCGLAEGDPHIRGFFGEKYELNAPAGTVVNLLSDEDVQVNMRMREGCRGDKTVFGAAAVQVGHKKILFVVDEEGTYEVPIVTMNGKELKLDQTKPLYSSEPGEIVSEEMRQLYVKRTFNEDKRYGGEQLEVQTHKYSIVITHRRHTHCKDVSRLDVSVQFRDSNARPEGVLGMTERATEPLTRDADLDKHDALKKSVLADYVVSDSRLFSDKFEKNRFQGAQRF